MGEVTSRSEHAAEGSMESADRASGQRWIDGRGDCGSGGQESAYGPPLAPPLYGHGGGWAFEGRNPAFARQAVES